jgi:hypothetical protein
MGRRSAGERGRSLLYDRSHKAIAALGQSFDVLGIARRVAEGSTPPGHDVVDSVLEIDRGVVGPQMALDFVPRDQFARVFEEHGQNPAGLILEPNNYAVLAKFAGSEIQLKGPKTHDFAHGVVLNCLDFEARYGRPEYIMPSTT